MTNGRKKFFFIILIAPVLSVLLAACGSGTTPTITTQYIVVTATIDSVAVTNTPDPCAPENLETEVQKTHKFMREFDDASTLASSRPREQLADAIENLQRIRRDAEDQPTPICLSSLKTYQISHMNAVINTLIAFMGGSDQQVVDQGIAVARELHDKYTLELARLLGATIFPASTLSPATQTPSP